MVRTLRMTCAMKNCLSTSTRNKELMFHPFPHSNEKILAEWIIKSGRPDLSEKNPYELKNTFLCSLHFEDNTYNRILFKDAVPNLLLADGIQTDSVKEVETNESNNMLQDNTEIIKAAIRNKKPMSDEQLDAVKRGILKAIINDPEDEPGPNFRGFAFKTGWLEINLKDQRSWDWLYHRIENIKPWGGAELSLMSETELPKPNIGFLYVPRTEAANPKDALKLIGKQNGLNTSLWKVLSVDNDKNGFTTALLIDEDSLEILHKLDFKTELGFFTAVLRMKDKYTVKNKNRNEEKGISKKVIRAGMENDKEVDVNTQANTLNKMVLGTVDAEKRLSPDSSSTSNVGFEAHMHINVERNLDESIMEILGTVDADKRPSPESPSTSNICSEAQMQIKVEPNLEESTTETTFDFASSIISVSSEGVWNAKKRCFEPVVHPNETLIPKINKIAKIILYRDPRIE